MSLTPEEFKEIENFTAQAPTLFTGFIMDLTPAGRANAASIASYLDGRSQKYTVANLTAAVIALQHVLLWTAGNAPIARSDKRPSDGRKYEPSIYSDAAAGIESDFARKVRESKEKLAAQLAAKDKATKRWAETHQVVQNKINGRQDFAASETLNDQARRRHLVEDQAEARAAGKKIPVAATGFRIIPDGETNFKGPADAPYTSAELSAYIARRKGRPGEPHGSNSRG